MITETTAVHSGRDSLGQLIECGPYVITRGRERKLVEVTADPTTEDLGVWYGYRWVRLDEIAADAVFSRLDNISHLPEGTRLSNIDAQLALARASREALAGVETWLAGELGCACGDGSPLWDGISAAVRDGMGTAVDLLDLAGALRR